MSDKNVCGQCLYFKQMAPDNQSSHCYLTEQPVGIFTRSCGTFEMVCKEEDTGHRDAQELAYYRANYPSPFLKRCRGTSNEES